MGELGQKRPRWDEIIGLKVGAGGAIRATGTSVRIKDKHVKRDSVDDLLQLCLVLARRRLSLHELFKGVRVCNGDGRLIGEHLQPPAVLLRDRFATEKAQHAEDLSSVNERVPGEAADLLPRRPLRAHEPVALRREVADQDRLATVANVSDFALFQRYAAEMALQERPILRVRVSRIPGAGCEV